MSPARGATGKSRIVIACKDPDGPMYNILGCAARSFILITICDAQLLVIPRSWVNLLWVA